MLDPHNILLATNYKSYIHKIANVGHWTHIPYLFFLLFIELFFQFPKEYKFMTWIS
jgi:hypothetical protein